MYRMLLPREFTRDVTPLYCNSIVHALLKSIRLVELNLFAVNLIIACRFLVQLYDFYENLAMLYLPATYNDALHKATPLGSLTG